MDNDQRTCIQHMIATEQANIERLQQEMPGKLRALDIAESRYYAMLDVLHAMEYEYDPDDQIVIPYVTVTVDYRQIKVGARSASEALVKALAILNSEEVRS